MSLQSAADVPLLIRSANSSSERRVSPSWSIAQLKTRLEPITGVPANCQQLSLRVGSQDPIPLAVADEEQTHLAAYPLQAYAEITVSRFFGLFHCIVLVALSLNMLLLLSSRNLPHCSLSIQLRTPWPLHLCRFCCSRRPCSVGFLFAASGGPLKAVNLSCVTCTLMNAPRSQSPRLLVLPRALRRALPIWWPDKPGVVWYSCGFHLRRPRVIENMLEHHLNLGLDCPLHLDPLHSIAFSFPGPLFFCSAFQPHSSLCSSLFGIPCSHVLLGWIDAPQHHICEQMTARKHGIILTILVLGHRHSPTCCPD